jgi:hypothetical protein
MRELTTKVVSRATPRRPVRVTVQVLRNIGVRGPPLQHPELYLQTIKQTYRRNSNEYKQ